VKADAAIVRALKAGQKGYRTLAAGAAADDSGKFAAGRRQVAKADRALKKALAQLSKQPQ
jgi:acyl CoA:acetate/3-ketoacid CoA transferase alpha subunit